MVGGRTPSRTARTHIIASIAPAAPKQWPVTDFVEDTASRYACSPKTSLIARVSAATLRSVELLEHQHAGALPHHEAGARGVEGARRPRRMFVLGGKAAHRAEAGKDEWSEGGFGAPGEDGVGVAALDHLRRLPDGGRARRAGGNGRVVRAAEAEGDRELAAGRVYEHVRNEGRRNAIGPTLAQHVHLLDDPHDPADRGAEEDPDPARRVRAVEPRVGHGLPRGAEREQDVAVEPPSVLRPGDLARVEVLHLRGDPHREFARVEARDEVNAALTGQSRAPRRRR